MGSSMNDWQDIATAPRDGTPIQLGWYRMVFMKNDAEWAISIGRWKNRIFSGGEWIFDTHGDRGVPTHWKSLPPPPKGEGE
jgi:hypothetical protein